MRVTTTTRGLAWPAKGVSVRLAVTDSAERSGVRGLGPPPGRRLALWEQPLTAYFGRDSAATAATAAATPWVYRLRAGALVQDERHLCNDCAATTYWIAGVSAAGFWGRWSGDFGAVAVQGRDGRFHDRAEGLFCATRLPPVGSGARDA
jgi:hypothetical protein